MLDQRCWCCVGGNRRRSTCVITLGDGKCRCHTDNLGHFRRHGDVNLFDGALLCTRRGCRGRTQLKSLDCHFKSKRRVQIHTSTAHSECNNVHHWSRHTKEEPVAQVISLLHCPLEPDGARTTPKLPTPRSSVPRSRLIHQAPRLARNDSPGVRGWST